MKKSGCEAFDESPNIPILHRIEYWDGYPHALYIQEELKI
jgi:hypothetical protein